MPRSAAASAGTASAPRCRPLSMRRLPTRIWRTEMEPVTSLPATSQARGSRRHARSLRPVDARCGIAGLMATTLGLPSVSVPVLVVQKRMTRSSRSRASAFLISTPDCAPRPTATMMDIGVAGPSMQGGKSGRGTARSYRPVRGACPRQRQCHRAKAQDGGPDGCAEPRRTLAKPGPAGTNCRPYR